MFSHGMGSNMTNYSCFCAWWASHGYIVVTPQHDKDYIRIHFDEEMMDRQHELEKMLYKKRN